MSGKLHQCRKVDLDFFDSAKILIATEVTLACSPDTLFRCFEDAGAWADWVDVIETAEWTSPRPFEKGTTRTVYMPGGMVAYEEFLVWDAPRQMAFRFNQFNKSFLNAFGENYEVTDLGNNRCRLVWTVGIEPRGIAGWVAPLLKPVLARNLKAITRELAKYIERDGERFTAA